MPSHDCLYFQSVKPFFQDSIIDRKKKEEERKLRIKFKQTARFFIVLEIIKKFIKVLLFFKIMIKSSNTFKQMVTDDLKIGTFLFQKPSKERK